MILEILILGRMKNYLPSTRICNNNPFLQYLGRLSLYNPTAPYAGLYNTFLKICEPALGYYLQATAVALWALAGLSTFFIDDPAPKSRVVVNHPNADYTACCQEILNNIARLPKKVKISTTKNNTAPLKLALEIKIANLENLNKEQNESTRDPSLDKIQANIAKLREQIKRSVTKDRKAPLKLALKIEIANLENYIKKQQEESSTIVDPSTKKCDEP